MKRKANFADNSTVTVDAKAAVKKKPEPGVATMFNSNLNACSIMPFVFINIFFVRFMIL